MYVGVLLGTDDSDGVSDGAGEIEGLKAVVEDGLDVGMLLGDTLLLGVAVG